MYRHPFIAFFVSISIFVQGQEAVITSAKCNSNYNEISAVPYKNGIVFISDRPSRFGISWVDAAGNYPSKIYYKSEAELRSQIDTIRKIRNRVFHHEKIHNYQYVLDKTKAILKYLSEESFKAFF